MPGQKKKITSDGDGKTATAASVVNSPSAEALTPCTIKSIVADADNRGDEAANDWQAADELTTLGKIGGGECCGACPQSAETPSVRLLHEFCDCTSFHGFHKIFQTSGLLHRGIWMLIIISATVGFTVHLCFLISRFFQSPVNTETQVYSTHFIFPDVTICSTSHFSQIRFAKNPHVGGKVNASISDLIGRIRRYWDPENPSENNSAINGDLRNSLKSYLHLVNITKQRQDLIVLCRYIGSACSYRNFAEYTDPEYVSCYTFTPKNRHLIVGGEKDGGLNLILYGGDGKNFITEEESLSFSMGFRVVIHEKGTRPNMMEGFYIQQGTNTYAQLAYTKETVLSKKNRPCIEDGSLPTIEFVDCMGHLKVYKYSITDCSMYRYQDYLHNTCNCLSETLPLPAIYQYEMGDFREKYCHRIPHSDELGSESSRDGENSSRDCHDRAVQTIHNLTAADRANCSISCTNRQYEMRLTQNKWPGEYGEATSALLKSVEETAVMARHDGLDSSVLDDMRQLITNDPNDGIHSFLKLNIYGHSTMGNMVVESWAYPARNLFSDIGGILGLWLGVSLISTFEFLELLINLANIWRQSRQLRMRKSGADGQEETRALAVNNNRQPTVTSSAPVNVDVSMI